MCPRDASASRLTLAVEATQRIFRQRFLEFQQQSTVQALAVHSEIEVLAIGSRNARFYSHFMPLLMNSAQIVAEAYCRYFKLALANSQECSPGPDEWACISASREHGSYIRLAQQLVGSSLRWRKSTRKTIGVCPNCAR